LRQIMHKTQRNVAILLDTKGPEIRTTKLENNQDVELVAGQKFTFYTNTDIIGNANGVALTYKNITQDLSAGNIILVDDGAIEMLVEDINDDKVTCCVLNSGMLGENKGINLPNVNVNLPALASKDKKDIIFGCEQQVDFIAGSFIRKAEDVLEIRELLDNNGGENIQIIAKIENQEGVDNFDAILEVADGIMVARGDLGVEIPAEEVIFAQKRMIKKCNLARKPVITATQMLDSMIKNPRPTRAEVTDVANAILDGTDAIMLSGETAIGKYPQSAVETMARIAEKIENSESYKDMLKNAMSNNIAITNAISYATGTIARDLNVSAILTATSSGYTARAVSKYRPDSMIIAATPSEVVMRKLAVVWGVRSVLTARMTSTDDAIESSVQSALDAGYLSQGELIVITAGIPVGVVGGTNMIKVHVVGDIFLKGTGLGKKPAVGRVCVANTPEMAEAKFQDGDILVTKETHKEMVPYMQRAAAVLTERGGLTSHAAVVGIALGIPVIVGVKDVTTELKDDDIITVDTDRGLVFKGKANIV